MINQYFRPQTIEEALSLLAQPDVRPLGGGTVLNRNSPIPFSVVDLQALGLDKIRKSDDKLEIGATVTLQALLESEHTPVALKTTIKHEAPVNLRDMGTVAGALVSCDGRSPFSAAMLALDAKLAIIGESASVVNLGDLLPLRDEQLRGKLLTKIEIPLNVKLTYEQVARTPMDLPIVCVALAQWASGRTRLVVGGWGSSPSVAMDGTIPAGVETAARNAAHDAADEWGSAEYRSNVAAVLAKRCLEN